MAKMVGLSRSIKLPWLDKTIELMGQDMSEQEFKDALNEYLSFEIGSPTVLRKTREILMHTWYYDEPETQALRDQALALIRKYPDDKLALHWCMLLAAYPVFQDLTRLVGKITEFQDEFTVKQLRQKLYDEWGERATLLHSLEKIVATMKYLGAIEAEKPGTYHVVKHKIKSQDVADFMIYAQMSLGDVSYYSVQDLKEMESLFPFEYQVSKESLTSDDRFILSNLGGELSIGVKE